MTSPDDKAIDAAAADAGGGTALAVVDGAGRLTRWTDSARRLLGYRAEEVLSTPAAGLLAAAAELPNGFTGAWSGTVGLRHRDGAPFPMGLRVSALPGLDGEMDWLVSMAPPDAAVLEAVGEACPFPMAVWDGDLRMTWLNDALAQAYGMPRELRLGRRLNESPLYRNTREVTRLLRKVLNTGVPEIDHELEQLDHYRHRAYALSVFPVANARDGRPGVCSLNVDVTSSRRTRERMTLLSRASRRIGAHLDVMQTAQDLADVLVPVLADYVTVDLAESVELGDAPLARLGSSHGDVPAFFRAGQMSIHDDFRESLWPRGSAVFVPPDSPFIEVLSSGRSHLETVLETGPGNWLDHDPRRRERILTLGMHTLLILPIHARDEILGIAVMVRTENPLPFDENDRTLAEELVSRAALSLDNARRYTREHTAALALQRDLLPSDPNGGNAVDVVSRYLPSDAEGGVGGDWFDVIPVSGARVALVVGDVVGHGINAAATMGRLRTAVITLAALDQPPDELLRNLDELYVRLTEESDGRALPTALMGATCLYMVYDPVTRCCVSARAGHPPPAFIDPATGEVSYLDIPSGAPLGIGTRSFQPVTHHVPEGSVLVLYTDGLVETREHDIDHGLEQLRLALTQPPGTGLEELTARAVGTLGDHRQDDDVAVLLARTRSLCPSRFATWEVPREAAAVAGLRAAAVRTLTAWGLERLVPAAEQIVGELLANAVLHGAVPIRLRLIRDRVLVVEVFDNGCSMPRQHKSSSADEAGRGVALAAALSSRFGVRSFPEGKSVWAELELPAGYTGPPC
ncbi:SpoIIE family protein phosphatase [Streptomyces sp. NPDC046977]|uniref:ATP-binding SpoIIE family protein phosphatase n=1 Tax=Streptomyces sp. NPDC046977 TaxID=3154703 RepID=UPI0033EF2949